MLNYLEVPGVYMHAEERTLIRNLSAEVAMSFGECNIVHIGVAWGGSMYCSRVGAPNCNLYGVDRVGFDDLKIPFEALSAKEIRGLSQDTWQDFQEPIHFLYVDGDHIYPSLSSDIVHWGEKIVKGGYIALHDCVGSHWSLDVNRAIDDNLSADKWYDLGIESWSRYFQRK